MSEHSRLAPSSAFRWRRCPLSVALSEKFRDLTEHPSGPEGTAAHWVWWAMLKSHKPAIGEMAPNGVAVTEEMLEGALQFIDRVFSLSNPHGGLSLVRLEERLTMHGIHPLMFGTPDGVVNLLEFTGELHILDYKFGHRAVDPFENDQLADYTFGVFESLGLTVEQIDNAKVIFHIIQPRCFHGRPESDKWETTGKGLRQIWAAHAEAAKEAITLELAARPKAGSWCYNCSGRRACPTFRRTNGEIMDWVDRSWPTAMPNDALGIELGFVRQARAMLESYDEALTAQAEYQLESGGTVPGWARERDKPGALKWQDGVNADDVIAIAQACDVELTKTQMAVTPTQAIAALKKKGFDDSVILAYSERKPGSMKLKPATETLAARVFGAIK